MIAFTAIAIAVIMQSVGPTANKTPPIAMMQADPLTVGHLRTTVELLKREGLTDREAERWTGVLATWLSHDGRRDGSSMQGASLALLSMLQDEAVSYSKLNAFCRYAPECFRYLAEGGGIDLDKVRGVVRRRHWETHDALAKMFAVANVEHGVSNEIYALMREAMALPPLPGWPPPK